MERPKKKVPMYVNMGKMKGRPELDPELAKLQQRDEIDHFEEVKLEPVKPGKKKVCLVDMDK